jgi:hypothetical protein
VIVPAGQDGQALVYTDANVTFPPPTPPPATPPQAASGSGLTVLGIGVNLPTAVTTVLSLVAGALAVLNQTTFGFPPPWGTSLTVVLMFLSGLGISPLVGPGFKNALHLSPQVSLAIATALGAAGTAALTISDEPIRALVVGVLTFLSGLGFGPVPRQS